MSSLKKYFSYFNFIRKNWNTPLAIFSIFHEIRGERKYKINTTGHDNLRNLKILSVNKPHAYIYQPVNYFIAEKAFDFINGKLTNPVLVDFGCGKGRILAIAAGYGYRDITGIEFAPELCRIAKENLKKISRKFPGLKSNVFCGDAIEYGIREKENIFCFFNPFDEKVMLPVVKNILSSLKNSPRDILVVYFNPTEKEIFLSAGFSELWYYSKMEYIDFSILFKEKDVG